MQIQSNKIQFPILFQFACNVIQYVPSKWKLIFTLKSYFFSIMWWMVTVNAQQGGAQVMYR
jgi:hypothetical protein